MFKILLLGKEFISTRVHGLESADRIWKTYCALHNYLLEIDGLDSKWEAGVKSYWEGRLGEHENNDIQNRRSLQRLNNPTAVRTYDTSGIGAGTDRMNNNKSQHIDELEDGTFIPDSTSEDGCIYVRNLSFSYFRMKLVTHFDIAYGKQEIIWPERSGLKEASI